MWSGAGSALRSSFPFGSRGSSGSGVSERGDHVLGQPVPEERFEDGRRSRLTPVPEDDVGGQLGRAARRVDRDDDAVGDGLVLAQDDLDLAELDAEASHLHLFVHPAAELEHAVGVQRPRSPVR